MPLGSQTAIQGGISDMRDDEDRGDEPGRDLDGFAVRNVSEFVYAGRPAVVVRTTHLHGGEELAAESAQSSPAAERAAGQPR